ncbi:transglycosylase domain-containing protein [Hymenobacter sp. BT186]|uniref:Transglycosylase domain-containing protein n=1 Tax=Hymenobacter telluris TaxID=2816474 RepID=A0A939EYJ6_9BACT|nr:transglycosylase domain-containing protein [Hymenobacter telluris]MBO0358253.1 transglycosylase domain-containing protein [Hymenobacter telluris]MBW3374279.1 transglycosylase domain-containing protein [Hymenobacter norwichensis]
MAQPATKSKNTPRKPQRSGRFTAFTRTLWVLFGGGFFAFLLYILAVSVNFLNLFGQMPNLKSLESPRSELASEVYSADGVLMGKYFRENRTPVSYEELAQTTIDALIATEDARFEQHSGIDPKAMARVVKGLVGGGKSGGGSTLSQQLAKMLFRTREDLNDGKLNDVPGLRMVITKTKEWILAVRLERNYTKREILRMYLNTAEFGSNAFGINVAAKTFFNKHPRDLKLEESALLVGLVNGPSWFNPVRNPERSKRRRDWVLSQMRKYNYIPEATYTATVAKPIKLDYKVENQNEGIAPYFRTELSKELREWAKETEHDLYADGLKIYTTIDSRMQKYAEAAVAEHMKLQQKWFDQQWKGQQPWRDENGRVIPNFLSNSIKRTARYQSLNARYDGNKDSIKYYLNKKYKMKVFTWNGGEKEVNMSPMDSLAYYKRLLHSGFMAMNPLNGQIKAWVGGINYKYIKYDHVKQGKRQPGSTFKPFVYVAAIDQGFSPCYQRPDVATTFPAERGRPAYTPRNFEGSYSGRTFTLRQALARSMNSITAWLVQKIGPDVIATYAKNMGITSPIDAVPAIGFGSSDVSIYELTGAYSTFVNKGVWTQPIMVTRIEDKNQNVLREFVPRTRTPLSEETAYLMTYMLRGATEEQGGTSIILKGGFKFPYEMGAKTGTTSNYSDGWFMGLTPNLVCGMWVGGEDRSIHFRTGAYGQGSRLALPLYGIFMKKVYADKNIDIDKKPFPRPDTLSVEIDCSRYYNGAKRDTIPYDQKLNQADLDDLNNEDI